MIAVSILIAGVAMGLGFDVTDQQKSPLVTRPGWIAAATAANELGLCLVVAAWVRISRAPVNEILPAGDRRFAMIGMAVLLVFGLAPAANTIGELTHRLTGFEMTSSRIIIAAARNASPVYFGLVLVSVSVLPAIAEEALFRGFVWRGFARTGQTGQLLVSSLLFGMLHLEPNQSAATVLLGVGFGLARRYSGGLVAPIIAHAVYNAAVVFAMRYAETPMDHQILVAPIVIGLVAAGGALAVLMRLGRERPPARELG